MADGFKTLRAMRVRETGTSYYQGMIEYNAPTKYALTGSTVISGRSFCLFKDTGTTFSFVKGVKLVYASSSPTIFKYDFESDKLVHLMRKNSFNQYLYVGDWTFGSLQDRSILVDSDIEADGITVEQMSITDYTVARDYWYSITWTSAEDSFED